jgi:hypothetical protein
MELAIINGTYRDSSKIQQKMNQILIPSTNSALVAAAAAATSGVRSPPNPLGQPLIISPRLAANTASSNPNLLNGNTHQLITSSTDPSTGLIYTTIPAIYSDPTAALTAAAASQALLEYPNGIDFSQAGMILNYLLIKVNHNLI